MATFSTEVTIQHATFTPIDAQGNPDPSPQNKIEVDFNPTSLQLQLSNTLEQKNGKTTEHVNTSSAKLTMDLIFDTSDTFGDVRQKTQRIVKLLIPRGGKSPSAGDVRPVLFEWGSFSFRGIIETYKETLDFFSASGLPLRASVNLTLSHQDLVFGDETEDANRRRTAQSLARGEAAPGGVSSMAQRSDTNGTQDTGRDIAAANGLESMRFTDGPVTISAGISLAPPVAFAAGGAAIGGGASAGAAFGAGAGLGFGAGASFGAGVSAGFGAGIGGGISGGIGGGISGGIGGGISGGIGGGISGGIGGGIGGGISAGIGGGIGGGIGISAGLSGGLSGGFSAGVSGGISAGVNGNGRAAVSFGASAGASVSASLNGFARNGAGGSASFRASASAVAQVALITPGEAPIFGGRASAGVPASLGAFNGLRAPLPRPRPQFDVTVLQPSRQTATLAIDRTATFDLAGRARLSAAGTALRVNGRVLMRGSVSFEQGG
jgi:hypothetical protein